MIKTVPCENGLNHIGVLRRLEIHKYYLHALLHFIAITFHTLIRRGRCHLGSSSCLALLSYCGSSCGNQSRCWSIGESHSSPFWLLTIKNWLKQPVWSKLKHIYDTNDIISLTFQLVVLSLDICTINSILCPSSPFLAHWKAYFYIMNLIHCLFYTLFTIKHLLSQKQNDYASNFSRKTRGLAIYLLGLIFTGLG